MFHYVYVLRSKLNGGLYVGYTLNLKRRLNEHNSGMNFSTKPGKPWQVIHYEAFLNERDALRREKYLKTNQGARLLKRLLKEYLFFIRVEK